MRSSFDRRSGRTDGHARALLPDVAGQRHRARAATALEGRPGAACDASPLGAPDARRSGRAAASGSGRPSGSRRACAASHRAWGRPRAVGTARARRAIRGHAGARVAHRRTGAAVFRSEPAGRSGLCRSRSARPRRRRDLRRAAAGDARHLGPAPGTAHAHQGSAHAPDAGAAGPGIASAARRHRRRHAPGRAHAGAHAAALAARARAPGARADLHAGRTPHGADGRRTCRHACQTRHPSPRCGANGAVHGRRPEQTGCGLRTPGDGRPVRRFAG